MIDRCTHLSSITIELDVPRVIDKISYGDNTDLMRKEIATVLEKAKNVWSPKAVLRRLDVLGTSAGQVVLAGTQGGSATQLSIGHAETFIKQAHQVVLGVYTVGAELEQAAARAARDKEYLESYLYEIIATQALTMVGSAINLLVEKEAAANDWKVGPLLSPGSVHGWELVEQIRFCELFDLEPAGIRCLENGVLMPFNSLSFMIGMGSEYAHTKVGSPCEVCSNRKTCEMKSGW